MAYIDEEIARVLKKERLKVREEMKKKEEEELDKTIEKEEVIAGIKEGRCKIFDKEYIFSHYVICGGRMEIDLPSTGIEIKNDQDNIFQSLSIELGFSCNAVLTDCKDEFEELSHYKEMMMKNMKNLPFQWEDEGSIFTNGLSIKYLDFIIMTGLGAIHNSMWFVMTPYGQAQLNLNYGQEDHRYFKHLINAMMKTLKAN